MQEKNNLKVAAQDARAVVDDVFNDFKIFHLNIQSLLNKIDALSLVLDSVKTNILCISEHWLDKVALKSVKITGYDLQASFCRDAGLHGGVAIYARDGEVYRDVNLACFSIPFHAEFAGIVCTELDCLVIAVYRSPARGLFQVFFEQLDKLLNALSVSFEKLIVLGDFNCDPDRCPKEARILDNIMTSYNLESTVTGYTRVTKSSMSRLDDVYINFFLNNYKTELHDPAISDHAGQIITLKRVHSFKRNRVYKNIISQPALVNLKAMLSSHSWAELYEGGLGGEDAMSLFFDVVTSYMSQCGVIKSVRVREQDSFPVNWYTEELKSMRNTMEALKTVCSVTQEASDWDSFRAYRNVYRVQLKRAKRSACSDFIRSAENRQKSCWRLINSVRSSSGQVLGRKSPFTADEFGSHFIDSIKQILTDIPTVRSADVDALGAIPVECPTVFLNPITSSELGSIILNLKNKTL